MPLWYYCIVFAPQKKKLLVAVATLLFLGCNCSTFDPRVSSPSLRDLAGSVPLAVYLGWRDIMVSLQIHPWLQQVAISRRSYHRSNLRVRVHATANERRECPSCDPYALRKNNKGGNLWENKRDTLMNPRIVPVGCVQKPGTTYSYKYLVYTVNTNPSVIQVHSLKWVSTIIQ